MSLSASRDLALTASGEKYRVLDLFSGIGGFSLGLEAAGMETVAFCEVSPVCRHLLAHHWPKVPCYDDVKTLTADRLAADGIAVDVICGGFPCQDLSYAGKGAGLAGERSGLWSEYARLIRELRPRLVIVENVAALLGRGLGVVLGDLAALGFDAEWDCIRAFDVGAPHLRDRLWIIAYARGEQHEGFGDAFRRALATELLEASVANACDLGYGPDDGLGQDTGSAGGVQSPQEKRQRVRAIAGGGGAALADAERHRLSQRRGVETAGNSGRGPSGISGHVQQGLPKQTAQVLADSDSDSGEGEFPRVTYEAGRAQPGKRPLGPRRNGLGWWSVEPNVGRVAHGVPARAHRLHGLGNAVVPQIPEALGRAILQSEREAA